MVSTWSDFTLDSSSKLSCLANVVGREVEAGEGVVNPRAGNARVVLASVNSMVPLVVC